MIILDVLWIQQSHEITERLCRHCGWESYRIVICLALGRTGFWRRQCEHVRKDRRSQPATWDSEQSIFGLQKVDLSLKSEVSWIVAKRTKKVTIVSQKTLSSLMS